MCVISAKCVHIKYYLGNKFIVERKQNGFRSKALILTTSNDLDNIQQTYRICASEDKYTIRLCASLSLHLSIVKSEEFDMSNPKINSGNYLNIAGKLECTISLNGRVTINKLQAKTYEELLEKVVSYFELYVSSNTNALLIEHKGSTNLLQTFIEYDRKFFLSEDFEYGIIAVEDRCYLANNVNNLEGNSYLHIIRPIQNIDNKIDYIIPINS